MPEGRIRTGALGATEGGCAPARQAPLTHFSLRSCRPPNRSAAAAGGAEAGLAKGGTGDVTELRVVALSNGNQAVYGDNNGDKTPTSPCAVGPAASRVAARRIDEVRHRQSTIVPF